MIKSIACPARRGTIAAKHYNQPLAFIDIETTGANYHYGKVTEIGVVRVEGGRVVRTFHTLLNPDSRLPAFITQLTGLTDADLRTAPHFADMADELRAILDGALFVAHNVRFDYSFIKQEYKRLGQGFEPELLCTVRLSRWLYPEHRGHSLEKIIQRFGFETARRHRALDDAKVLWDFWHRILADHDLDSLNTAIAQQLKRQSLPPHLDASLIQTLPESPGVYVFEDDQALPLYVGKSVNIRSRVLSHLSDDHRQYRELRLAQQTHHIRTIKTAGEIGALLLESRLVKELQPLHNRKLRRAERLFVVEFTTNAVGYLTGHIGDYSEELSPDTIHIGYRSRKEARETLEGITAEHHLCPRLMGLDKSRGTCFAQQLGKCSGACLGTISPASYNLLLTQALSDQRLSKWPFAGAALLLERSADLERVDGFIIDQWRVTALLLESEFGDPEYQKLDLGFDMDVYKILRQVLEQRPSQIELRPLSPTELAQLSNTAEPHYAT